MFSNVFRRMFLEECSLEECFQKNVLEECFQNTSLLKILLNVLFNILLNSMLADIQITHTKDKSIRRKRITDCSSIAATSGLYSRLQSGPLVTKSFLSHVPCRRTLSIVFHKFQTINRPRVQFYNNRPRFNSNCVETNLYNQDALNNITRTL